MNQPQLRGRIGSGSYVIPTTTPESNPTPALPLQMAQGVYDATAAIIAKAMGVDPATAANGGYTPFNIDSAVKAGQVTLQAATALGVPAVGISAAIGDVLGGLDPTGGIMSGLATTATNWAVWVVIGLLALGLTVAVVWPEAPKDVINMTKEAVKSGGEAAAVAA